MRNPSSSPGIARAILLSRRGVAAIAAGIVAACAGQTGANARATPAPRPRERAPRTVNAFIQRTTDRGATVRVAATEPVRVEVCVSAAGSGGNRCDRRITSMRARRNHLIPVRGLLPDTTYRYRVTELAADASRLPGEERPSKTPGVIKQADLRSAPEGEGGDAVRIDAGPQIVALATVAGARWETSVYGNGRLDYQEVANADGALTLDQQFELPRYANRRLPDALTADHRVCIGPLLPETVYSYTVTSVAGTAPATSPIKRFATLAAGSVAPGDFTVARRFGLDWQPDGLVALPDGGLLTWNRAGTVGILRLAASGPIERAMWTAGVAIGGAAAAPNGRIFLALPGPPNQAGLATTIIRVSTPDAAASTGYAPTAELGPLIGAPGALALDSSGNLAALTTLTGDNGIPEAQFNLFDADPAAPGGFTLRFALWPFGQATALAGTAGGSILLLAASRAIVALAGDIHNPQGAVTVWDGRSAGRGPWIEAAAIAADPAGDLHLIDGCTGGLQAVGVDPVSGAFTAQAAGNTRDLPGGLAGTPIALAVDRNGTALVLERASGGERAIIQFRRSGMAAAASSSVHAGAPLDHAAWRPSDRRRGAIGMSNS